MYDYEWKHRCQVCDYPCKSPTGVKIHRSKAHKEYDPAGFTNKYVRPPQDFMNRLADKAVQKEKLKLQQKE